jgi:hypothetical protein
MHLLVAAAAENYDYDGYDNEYPDAVVVVKQFATHG